MKEDITIATWNMQGCNAGEKLAAAKSVFEEEEDLELMLLQETGEPSEWLLNYQNSPTHYTGEIKFTRNNTEQILRVIGKYWNKTRKEGNLRCSYAVITTLEWHEFGWFEVAPEYTRERVRDLFGIQFSFGESRLCVASIHAVADGRTSPEHVAGLIGGFFSYPDPDYWIIGGDFNEEPDKILGKTPASLTSRIACCPPELPTHNAKKFPVTRSIDYFLHSKNLRSSNPRIGTNDECGRCLTLASDHFGQIVRFDIES